MSFSILDVVRAYIDLWRIKAKLKADITWFRDRVEIDGSSPPKSRVADPDLLKLHESVRLAARLHRGATDCLPKSICLSEMAKRRGICSKVKIGVNLESDKLSSHAWVEVTEGNGSLLLSEPESVVRDFTSLGTRNSE